MFKLFKRQKPVAAQPTPRASSVQQRPATTTAAPRRPVAVAAPLPEAPLPEVVAEGNTQADWGAWEDSMITWDSQMQGLVPSQRVYVREATNSRLDELDPFAGVRTKRNG